MGMGTLVEERVTHLRWGCVKPLGEAEACWAPPLQGQPCSTQLGQAGREVTIDGLGAKRHGRGPGALWMWSLGEGGDCQRAGASHLCTMCERGFGRRGGRWGAGRSPGLVPGKRGGSRRHQTGVGTDLPEGLWGYMEHRGAAGPARGGSDG